MIRRVELVGPLGHCLSTPTVRQVRPDDWDLVRALLRAADLPVDDLGPGRLGGLLIAEDDEAMLGLIGLDVFGAAGLLRALVVAKGARGSGLDGKLVGALEAAAAAAGIDTLWLLTIDAQRFFSGMILKLSIERSHRTIFVRPTNSAHFAPTTRC